MSHWLAEYLNPDNFLRVAMHDTARHWRNPGHVQLLETARRRADQAEHLKFFASADRLLM